MEKFENVTICLKSTFGVNQIQCKSASIKIRPYAQYNNAIELRYIPKGKRKEIGVIITYNPYLLILKGFVNLEYSAFEKVESSENFTITKSKYSCFSDNYTKDFDKLLESTKNEILKDLRNHNSY